MNVARVMGNSLDPVYIPHLVKAFTENGDERVKGMAAWSLGRIGGIEAKAALDRFSKSTNAESVRNEIEAALQKYR